MQTEKSVEIDRPIDEVFEYTTNNVAEWSIVVLESEVIEEKPEGVGTRFRIVTEERGKRMEFDGVVTLHQPPVAQAVYMKGSHFDIEGEYRFEDLGGGRTRLTQRSTVNGKGFGKVILALCGWMMNKSSCNALEKELVNLKRILEARESPAAT